jgi:hypothetical protein
MTHFLWVQRNRKEADEKPGHAAVQKSLPVDNY